MEPKKIVLTEDDDYVVEYMSHILKKNGYQVVVARDGVKALEIIPKEQPALLILDFMMPKMNALQVLEELSRSDQTRDIPKIVMTASLKERVEENAKKYGIKSVMEKPFNANDLLKAVKDLLAD